MLKRLTLENFRKHEHLVLDFDPGLVVLRGNNEAGKSTIFQALAYVLFGARALPEPLEGVVTYGKAPASLRVTLTAVLGGAEVDVARSSRGAEARVGDRLVTGQTEVANLVSELVGAPAALANSLFFANQGSIRGALASGSKATTSLIEQLADFEQIDKLLELIQTHLPTGPTKLFEERITQAEATLEKVGEPTPPADMTAEITQLANRLSELGKEHATASVDWSLYNDEVVKPKLAAKESARQLEDLIVDRTKRLDALQTELGALTLPAYDIEAHRGAVMVLGDYEKLEKARAAWKRASAAFAALPIVRSVWEGDGPSFIKFSEESESWRLRTEKDLADIGSKTQIAESQIQIGSCNVCGLEYDKVETVGERNAKTRREVAAMKEFQKKLQGDKRRLDEERSAIKLINQQWQIFRDFIAKHGDYVKVDNAFVPPKVEWTAAELPATSYEQVKADVAQYERDAKAHNEVRGRRDLLAEQIEGLREQIGNFEANLTITRDKFEDLPAVLAREEQLHKAMLAAVQMEAACRTMLDEVRNEYERALELHTERRRTFDLAKKQVEDARKQLAEVSFNNTLLKAIRAARPTVIDQLWAALLAAISHYFSAMRGAASTVTRSEGAFLVDGKPVEGLSGSTLDVLGLAIRVALLKTFLPNCSFLVLDEPAAACDAEREAALIGTIATAQFDQVVLVTHSDLADAFAHQLLTL